MLNLTHLGYVFIIFNTWVYDFRCLNLILMWFCFQKNFINWELLGNFSETGYQNFPSAWALKLQSIMGEIWLIESYLYFWVLNYFFKVPHTLRHPRGLLLPLDTRCIKLYGGIWPLGWSGRWESKFIEYTVLAVKTCDKTRESANIFMF